MAVAEEPLIYTEMDGNGGYIEMGNSLYRIRKGLEKNRFYLPWFLGCLVLGLLLMLASLFLSGARREAKRRIAG